MVQKDINKMENSSREELMLMITLNWEQITLTRHYFEVNKIIK